MNEAINSNGQPPANWSGTLAARPTARQLVHGLIDYGIVHASWLFAFAACAEFYAVTLNRDREALIAGGLHYYFLLFCPCSLIFPALFAAAGFYQAGYSDSWIRLRWRRVQGAAISIGVFLFMNYVLCPLQLAPRSVALIFAVALPLGLLAKTRLWALIERNFEIRPRTTSGFSMMQGPVLVVGGAGYIGSVLVRKLLDSGRRVRVLDSLLFGDDAIVALRTHPRFELIEGDCRDIQTVVNAVSGVESIVHLAAIVGDPACEQDRDAALEINYAATRMLIEVAKGHGIRRLVFASSCSVYGASPDEVSELSPAAPLSLYAQTKVDSERALLEACSPNFQPVIMRFATVFGYSYRPRFDLVVNLLVGKAYQDKKITIFNSEQWRPFIHVHDAAHAVTCALRAPLTAVGGQIFNVGDARLNYTLADVARNVRAIIPETEIDFIQNTDRRNYRVSFKKIEHRLGFRALITLEDGVAELHRALQSGKVRDYKELIYNNQQYLQDRRCARTNGTAKKIMAAFSETDAHQPAAA